MTRLNICYDDICMLQRGFSVALLQHVAHAPSGPQVANIRIDNGWHTSRLQPKRRQQRDKSLSKRRFKVKVGMGHNFMVKHGRLFRKSGMRMRRCHLRTHQIHQTPVARGITSSLNASRRPSGILRQGSSGSVLRLEKRSGGNCSCGSHVATPPQA